MTLFDSQVLTTQATVHHYSQELMDDKLYGWSALMSDLDLRQFRLTCHQEESDRSQRQLNTWNNFSYIACLTVNPRAQSITQTHSTMTRYL